MNDSIRLFTSVIQSPLGPLTLVASDEALVSLSFDTSDKGTLLVPPLRKGARGISPPEFAELGKSSPALLSQRREKEEALLSQRREEEGISPILEQCAKQLEEYFSKKRNTFSIPLAIGQLSPFRQRFTGLLQKVPHGQTTTYGDLAEHFSKNHARAVGLACGKNPWPIIVPCHRVLAKDGTLGGFSGELWRKEALLELERQ